MAAEQQGSKFANLFDDRLKNPPSAPPGRSKPAPIAVEARAAGRAPGKRSDPEFKPFTILLKKQTHKQANRLLEDMDTGRDLSDLMQELLAGWVEKQTRKAEKA